MCAGVGDLFRIAGFEEGKGGDAGGVGEEVEGAEVGAEEAGGEAEGEVVGLGEGGGDEGELEEFDGEHDDGGGEGDAGSEAGETDEDVDHCGVEGVAEVFVGEGVSGGDGAGEEPEYDDGGEEGGPGARGHYQSQEVAQISMRWAGEVAASILRTAAVWSLTASGRRVCLTRDLSSAREGWPADLRWR